MSKSYQYHKPSEDGLSKIAVLRQAFATIDDIMRENCPQSRELSLAITNLEQSAMWAIKAVVVNDPESEVAE